MTVVKGRDFHFTVLKRREIFWTMNGRKSKVHLTHGRPDLKYRHRAINTLCGIVFVPMIRNIDVQEYPSRARVKSMFCKNCLRLEEGIERRQHDH